MISVQIVHSISSWSFASIFYCLALASVWEESGVGRLSVELIVSIKVNAIEFESPTWSWRRRVTSSPLTNFFRFPRPTFSPFTKVPFELVSSSSTTRSESGVLVTDSGPPLICKLQ
jgi:hypothetical protein